MSIRLQIFWLTNFLPKVMRQISAGLTDSSPNDADTYSHADTIRQTVLGVPSISQPSVT